MAQHTPTLDAILGELPPLALKVELTISSSMSAYMDAYQRLEEKFDTGTLTQVAIEQELNGIPAIGGAEQIKHDLVKAVRMIVPGYDIKKLPVEFLSEE